VAKVLQHWDDPHTLLGVDDEPFVFQGLQDLPHMAYMLLMGPTVDDNVVHSSKSCLAILDGPIHVQLEGCPGVLETEGHFLVLEEAKGGGDGGLLHVF
jgi:hypothetical protein